MGKGSTLVLHWKMRTNKKKDQFPPGLAYVMLSRCESEEDVYILGDFDPNQIIADPEAKAETERLHEIVLRREALSYDLIESTSLILGCLNVSSLRKHFEDVLTDPFIMSCDIFGLCETWLHEGEEVEFPDFNGIFVSYAGELARGKGIAVFTKGPVDHEILKADDASASGVCVKLYNVNVIFLYLSQNFDWSLLREFFDKVISPDKPTVIMGDVNWHYPEKHPMKEYLQMRDFAQMVRRATHMEGRIIDHLYTSNHYKDVEFPFEQESIPYSDHDLITAYVPLNSNKSPLG